MMSPIPRALPLVLVGLLALPSATGALTIFSDVGLAPGDIQDTVAAFQAALGNPDNGNAPGPLPSGRREINWDGGGATNGTAAITPFTVFQNTRGATFTTPGSGLTQSPITGGTVDIAPTLPGLQANLADLNPTYATTFATFSPLRLFVPLDSNIIEGTFSVPGTGGTVPAGTQGFGAVFTDVDVEGLTTIEFFDAANQLIFSENVPALAGNGTLSFLGLLLGPGEGLIGRIRITTGNSPLGPNDTPTLDVVAVDDFLYAEPRSIPQPDTLMLLGVGLIVGGVTAWTARRRKNR